VPNPRPDHWLPTDGRPPIRPHRFAGTPSDRPSPLQNRVLPTGEIVAVPERGLLTGNRGCLHSAGRTLGVTRWRSKMWICCLLKWGDIRRDVMPPGRWTALFFLDEATALSAGHRPCGYCRRPDHLDFGEAWRQAAGLAERPKAARMDIELHAERVDRRRRKLVRTSTLADLPNGAMVRADGITALRSDGRLLPWSLAGYAAPFEIDPARTVEVLTPPSVLGALRHGYRPLVHPSAGRTSLRAFAEA
jgi:hypothetical protein